MRGLGAAIIGAVALLLSSSDAEAGGMYFTDRGVRPMGRAGAFVAGADDLGAIWYNPAGLADAGKSALVDFSYLRFSSEYTREVEVTTTAGAKTTLRDPTVHGEAPFLPLPTIAGSWTLGKTDEWTIGGGIFAPNMALATYPKVAGGQPASSRYAAGSFEGSLASFIGAGLAWKPMPELRVGLGVNALVGFLESSLTLSASPPDRLVGAPEQPEYDAESRFRAGPIIAPSGNIGVIYVPTDLVRLGASFQGPTFVNAPARLDVRLPQSALFDGARVSGHDATVRFALPPIVRMGVELRPLANVRVEAAYVREFWSIHDSIDVIPDDVALDGVSGLPARLPIPRIRLPRNFVDTNSFRVGGEAMLGPVTLRGGASYETSGIPPEYLSVLTIDSDKVTVAGGIGVDLGSIRLDATYAHVFASSVHVAASEAKIPRTSPLAGNAKLEGVNGGVYEASADLFGIGAQYKF